MELERALEVLCYSLSFINNSIVDKDHLRSSDCVLGTVIMTEEETGIQRTM